MARESPYYRDTLELLNDKFQGRVLLTVPEVMEITGYTSRNSIYKYFPVDNGRVNVVALARCLSKNKESKHD